MSLLMATMMGQSVGFEASDTFAGTLNDPVSGRTTDTGGLTWGNVNAGNPPLLNGSGSVKLTSNGNTFAQVQMPTGDNDITVNGIGGSGGSVTSRIIGVIARASAINTYIRLWSTNSTGVVAIQKVVSGTATTLSSATVSAINNGVSHDYRLVTVGNQLDAYVDGVLVVSHTLTGGDATTFSNVNTGVGFTFNGFGTTLINSFYAESV